MADKQTWLDFNSCVNGQSNDETGSTNTVLYSENLWLRDEKTRVRLGDYYAKTYTNKRTDGGNIFMDEFGWEIIGLTKDWYVETKDSRNYYKTSYTPTQRAWPLYSSGNTYLNGLLINGNLLAFSASSMDRYSLVGNVNTGAGIVITADEKVTNRTLTTTSWWSFWSWWSATASGALHSTGTAALTYSWFVPVAEKYKATIVVVWATAGTLTVKLGSLTLWTITVSDNSVPTNKYLYNTFFFTGNSTDVLTLTPTTDWDWLVINTSILQVTPWNVHLSEVTFSDVWAKVRPVLAIWWLVYVGGWRYVDIINTDILYSTIESTLKLAAWEVVMGITNIWDRINVYVNNWNNWVLYIWDGISTSPSERVQYKNKAFISIENNGNYDYIVCGNTDKQYLYIINGWERQLIYNSLNVVWQLDKKAFRLKNRFSSYSSYIQSTEIYWDLLYIGTQYGMMVYGKKLWWYPTITDRKYRWDIAEVMAAYSNISSIYISGKEYLQTTNYNIILTEHSTQFSPSGYLVTNPIYWNKQSSVKQVTRMHFWYNFTALDQQINTYVAMDDNRFITFYVNGVTIAPIQWEIYSVIGNTITIIKSDIVGGIWTVVWTLEWDSKSLITAAGNITKVSGVWDNSIAYTDYDNFILLKTTTPTEYTHGDEYIFAEDFVNHYMDDFHKIMFKRELIRGADTYSSPEMYDLYLDAKVIRSNE